MCRIAKLVADVRNMTKVTSLTALLKPMLPIRNFVIIGYIRPPKLAPVATIPMAIAFLLTNHVAATLFSVSASVTYTNACYD